MVALTFDPAFPKRVTDAAFDHHPTAVETTRGLVAVVYERAGSLWRSYSLDHGQTWSEEARFGFQTPVYSPRAKFNNRDGFAMVWGNPLDARDVWFEEINEVMTISDHLMGVRIQRAMGTTAKGGELTIINPRRLYDPEVPGTQWTGVFYPGARVEVSLGYGGNMKKRFSGYIDDAESEDRAGYLTLSLRGQFKYLLDQNIKRPLKYINERRTKNIVDLAIEAGFKAEEIQVESSALVFTETFDRKSTYSEIISGHCEALGFEMFEPDEGGLIARTPVVSAAASWFYEEEKNMYSRTRNWDDDEVPTWVMAYRETVYSDENPNVVKVAALMYEESVGSPFLTPPRKTEFIELSEHHTLAQAQALVRARIAHAKRRGQGLQIVTPLNVALEIGDTIYVRRKTWNQSGLYLVEALDDDCKRNLGQSRELAGTSRGGQFAAGQGGGGGFANVVQTRKIG